MNEQLITPEKALEILVGELNKWVPLGTWRAEYSKTFTVFLAAVKENEKLKEQLQLLIADMAQNEINVNDLQDELAELKKLPTDAERKKALDYFKTLTCEWDEKYVDKRHLVMRDKICACIVAPRPRVTKKEVEEWVDNIIGFYRDGGGTRMLIGRLREKGVEVEEEKP